MKCYKCNGTGIDDDRLTCYKCGGTGEMEQTNEKWFDSLTTEKKAKIIKMVINTCVSCQAHGTIKTRGCLLRQKIAKDLLFLPCMDESGIVEWLKEKHESDGNMKRICYEYL